MLYRSTAIVPLVIRTGKHNVPIAVFGLLKSDRWNATPLGDENVCTSINS